MKNKIHDLLKHLLGKEIVFDTTDILLPNLQFPEGKPFLREFYENFIFAKLEDSSIIVKEILHQNFCERYKFQKHNLTAIIDFYYNGKGIFTTKTPQPTSGNSTDLLSELIKLL